MFYDGGLSRSDLGDALGVVEYRGVFGQQRAHEIPGIVCDVLDENGNPISFE